MVCHWSRIRPVLSRSGRTVRFRRAARALPARRSGLAVIREETAVGEEALASAASPSRSGQFTGFKASKASSESAVSAPMIEIAAAIVLERRECGVLAENIGGGLVVEAVAEADALCDLAEIHQSGRASPGARQERALARDAAFGVGHRAVLLAPGRAGSSTCAPASTVSFESTFSETTNSSSFFSASRTASASRQRHRRVGRPSPTAP